MNLEDLGFSKEELQARVIEQAVDRLLADTYYDEDGIENTTRSKLSRDIQNLVIEHVDQKVAELAETHVLPRVSAFVEEVSIQKTNEYGERRGEAMTFIEYLVHRSETYLLEKVNYEGKTRAEDRRNSSFGGFKEAGTRVSFLVDKHLQYSIGRAMEKGLKSVNEQIADGIAEAVKIQLEQIVGKIQAKVEVKR